MAQLPDTVPEVDSASPTALSFETALAELEGIVSAMETGQMPLQEALDAYRRGTALLRHCQETLDGAAQQVRMLDGNELRELDGAPTGPAAGKQEN